MELCSDTRPGFLVVLKPFCDKLLPLKKKIRIPHTSSMPILIRFFNTYALSFWHKWPQDTRKI